MMNLETVKKNIAQKTGLATAPTHILIVGLGVTGLSIARFLKKIELNFSLIDSRPNLGNLTQIKAMFADSELFTGGFPEAEFKGVTHLFVSPGVSLDEPAIAKCLNEGAVLLSDIDLFAFCIDAPVIAITGSNGKSTVTTMVEDMARVAGMKVRAGGNLGVPALDLIADDIALYILELSSFQLERMTALKPQAAVVLNVSSDHMDRYSNIEVYANVKSKIYDQATTCVINVDDPRVLAMVTIKPTTITYSVTKRASFSVRNESGSSWLVKGGKAVIARSQILVVGEHNTSNALAAMALATAVGIPMESIVDALRDYQGLPHRLQIVSVDHELIWVNDSKATNPSSCMAALKAFDEKVVLIAGGDCKGADLTELATIIQQQARIVILFGRDAQRIEDALENSVPVYNSKTLEGAVLVAKELAIAGETVLLSPACASLDQFKDYQERGDIFAQTVRRIAA
ncbi:MAG TPA: UDP-N-acetylmuramoyl-L-alanine--D-glutamate ligase [Methylococcales bacterium]|nr:UDP-N-acetylmuramoyl-L-alanine--D-glutamate ligase [Methylococcales bacterium]